MLIVFPPTCKLDAYYNVITSYVITFIKYRLLGKRYDHIDD